MPCWLGAVSLAVAVACGGDDSSGDSEAATSGAETTSSSTAGTESPTSSAGETEAATEGTAGTSGAVDDTAGSTGEPPDPLAACMATCEHLNRCEVEDVPNCGIPCASIGSRVDGCVALYVAQQECVVALSCEDAGAWADGGGGARGRCAAEDDALDRCLAEG